MGFDIVTFGSAVIDTFVSTELAEKGNFFNYPLGEKILIKALKFDIGGGGANTAVAFSRLGFRTGCICKTGNDDNGETIKRLLKKERVSLLCAKTENDTGYSIILDSKKRERTILTYKGANDCVSMRDIRPFRTSWLYLSSVLGKSLETQKKLAVQLAKSGTKVAFNPSSYLIRDANIAQLLKTASVLIVNREEASLICKKYLKSSSLESIKKLGPEVIAITDGENDVVCYAYGKKYTTRPPKVNVQEMTGAGDAFAAGFVSGLMLRWPIKRCMQMGCREGVAVITQIGAKHNLLKMKLRRNSS